LKAATEAQQFYCCFIPASVRKSDGRGTGAAAPWQRAAAQVPGDDTGDPSTQSLQLADAAPSTARLVAEPWGCRHFGLAGNLLSLETTQITNSLRTAA